MDSPEGPTGDRRRGFRARARDKKEADPEGQAASEEVAVVDEAVAEEVAVVDEAVSEEDAVENEAGEDKAEREAD